MSLQGRACAHLVAVAVLVPTVVPLGHVVCLVCVDMVEFLHGVTFLAHHTQGAALVILAPYGLWEMDVTAQMETNHTLHK